MSGFDEDFLAELDEPIAQGRIVLEAAGSKYEALLQERFLWTLTGRIDWSKVTPILAARFSFERWRDQPNVEGARQPETMMRWFLSGVALQTGVRSDQMLVCIGDEISHVVRLSFSTAVEYCRTLFSYPQHSYLAPLDCSWVCQYTFEDDMTFGFAPDQSAEDG